MPSNRQRSVPFRSVALLSFASVFFVAALAVALGVAPHARADATRWAHFMVTVQVVETAQETITSTDPNDQGPIVCDRGIPPGSEFSHPAVTVPRPPPFTGSQTIRLSTTKAQSVTALMDTTGRYQGHVQLSSDLSSGDYAELKGIVGTIERHNNNPPTVQEACDGKPASVKDCGTKSPKHWRMTLDRISSRRNGREQFQGLGVNFDTPYARPFVTCEGAEAPHGFSGNVANIDAPSLFDPHRRQIVLRIEGTIPWRYEDKNSKRVTEGTYSRSITVTLRRTATPGR